MIRQTVWTAGNSLVITIPAAFARQLRLKHGTVITIQKTLSGAIKITPTWLPPPKRVKDTPGFKPKRPT